MVEYTDSNLACYSTIHGQYKQLFPDVLVNINVAAQSLPENTKSRGQTNKQKIVSHEILVN